MPWRPIETDSEDAKRFLSRLKKRPRFLLDENVDRELAQYLRSLGYNVREISGTLDAGRDDSEIYEIALKDGRIIVTHDGVHFWNDRKCPIDKTAGVAVLGSSKAGAEAIYMLWLMGDWAEHWRGQKAWFYPNGELRIKNRNLETGRVTETRYRFRPRRAPEEWVGS